MLDKLFQIEWVSFGAIKRDTVIGPGHSTAAWIGEREGKAMCTNTKLCAVLVHCSSIRFAFVHHWGSCRAVNSHIGDSSRLFRCIDHAKGKYHIGTTNG